ncbi:MAG TPA: integrase [Gallionellaceae bacterium]|nr:integrase [Gallionellaceae bacterium]
MGKLSDKEIRAAKPSEKQYKLTDGDGLILVVRTTGAKLWQLRYRFGGKEKTLSIGEYPLVPLATARENAFKARQSIREGVDPSAAKQAARAALAMQSEQKQHDARSVFEVVAREWFEKHRLSLKWEDNHSSKILGRLEKDIFPWLGKRPVAEITAPELLSVIRKIEARGALETAHRALSECGRVFRYAVASGLAERDPSGDLKGALPPYRKDNHFAAITDPKVVGELLRDIEGYSGTHVVRAAFALSPRVFLRPGELRKLEWEWIDFESAMITVPPSAHKTGKKTQAPHLVPLSRQAIQILKEIQPLTGNGKFVFPSERDKNRPMSDNGVRSAMRRMGWTGEEMTPHGFRALASTILDNLGYKQEWIERQLAHDEHNKVKAAYKRDLFLMYLPERKRMMAEWSDYLDALRNGASVIPFKVA